jgi:hypothetical protein
MKLSYFCRYKVIVMRLIILVPLVYSLLFSCIGESNVVHVRTVKGQKKEAVKVKANRMLTVEIEGMACEMACGGSIRSHLKSTGAVERVQFDFEDGRRIQTAFITYNSKKISDEEMLELIQSINEKQFTTYNYNSKVLGVSRVPDQSEKNSTKETSKINVSEVNPSIELPNLFDLLKNLVQ